MQNTLEINTDKSKIYSVYLIWFFFALSCVINWPVVGNSLSISILIQSTFFLLAASLHLYAIQSLKRKINIQKDKGNIEIVEFNIFGKAKTKPFPITEFCAVRSYVLSTSGGGNSNVVELVRENDNFGLFLKNFNPSSGNKFWTLKSSHLENLEAESLRIKIADFLDITDLGFLGVTNKGFEQVR